MLKALVFIPCQALPLQSLLVLSDRWTGTTTMDQQYHLSGGLKEKGKREKEKIVLPFSLYLSPWVTQQIKQRFRNLLEML